MFNFKVSSDYGHINLGYFYIGWNNNVIQPKIGYSDEQFGLAIGKLYLGVYNNTVSFGILNQYGCLDD
jgi:hypothetical protein